MAKLNIVKIGDDTLRRVCRPVEKITPRTVTLLDDMIQTMRDADGCGLAAPQVGILRRIAVVEVEEGNVIELINPKIIAYAGEQQEQEGCLSIPGRWGITKRPKHVTAAAGLVGLSDHAHYLLTGLYEGFQRKEGKIGSAHKQNTHQSFNSSTMQSIKSLPSRWSIS